MKNIVDATIEIPMGTRNKYEIDKKTGRIRLDRVQYSTLTYPAEYGFIEETLSDDQDPIDVLILTTEATVPGCIVECKILGYLETVDNGFEDPKLIAVNNVDPRYSDYKDIDDLPKHTLLEIKNFFETYKRLQHITVTTGTFHNAKDALYVIEKAKENYQRQKK